MPADDDLIAELATPNDEPSGEHDPDQSDDNGGREAFDWTDDQLEARRKLRRFLDEAFADPADARFGLYGYAGTGKTALIQDLCLDYQGGGRVAMVAPTHQAVGVLEERAREHVELVCGDDEVAFASDVADDFDTVHSFLNLKHERDGGDERFVADEDNPPFLRPYDVVVVDECSMIDEHLWGLMDRFQVRHDFKVVYMGDPLQLPPVNADASPTFDLDRSTTLREIVRHDGVVERAAADARDAVGDRGTIVATPGEGDRGRVALWGDRSDWVDHATSACREDGPSVKVLAFTNDRVDRINGRIRRAVYGDDADPFVEGERLVAVRTHAPDDEVILHTEDACEVLSAQKGGYKGIECWRLQVRVEGSGEEWTVHALASDRAWREYRARLDDYADAQEWGAFWDLKDTFAKLRPPYATTIHKSQGGTYDRVYVDQRSLESHFKGRNTQSDRRLRDRLLYVAYSRAADELHVHTGRGGDGSGSGSGTFVPADDDGDGGGSDVSAPPPSW